MNSCSKVASRQSPVSLFNRSRARRRMCRGQNAQGSPSRVRISPMKKYSGAPFSNGTNTRVLASGMRKTSPRVPNGVIWMGPKAERKMLLGARPTPRCSRDARSAAGKLLPRKCPDRSLVPTKTICSRCINPPLASGDGSSYREFGTMPPAQHPTIYQTDAEPCKSERHGKRAHARQDRQYHEDPRERHDQVHDPLSRSPLEPKQGNDRNVEQQESGERS